MRINKFMFWLTRRLLRQYYRTTKLFYKSANHFFDKRGLRNSSSLAFTATLAFIPLSIALANISQIMPFSRRITEGVQQYFLNDYIPQSGGELYRIVTLSIQHSAQLSWFSFILLIASCYGVLFEIQDLFNIMSYRKLKVKFSRSILRFSLFFIIGPFFVYALGYINQAVNELTDFHFQRVLVSVTSWIFTFGVFIALYKFIPVQKILFRHAVVVGLAAGTVFLSLQEYFIYSIKELKENYQLLYGSLAMLPIFLLWIYLSTFILLFGIQVIYTWEKYFTPHNYGTNKKTVTD